MNCAVNSPVPGIMPRITPKPEATVATLLCFISSLNPAVKLPEIGFALGVELASVSKKND